MAVDLATVSRADLSDKITIVGNLVGEATVEAVPKVAGRLQQINVRLGDRVSRGQVLAKIEDSEIRQQVKQAEASFNVAQATVRQREADVKFAQTNYERSRSLFAGQLLPQSSMDDADARQQAATAQLDLARAQFEQATARLEELRINLANTIISSPVDGFVGKRTLDQGAYVTPNSSFLSVVDIRVVKLLVNVIESDLRRISAGTAAVVQVDAYPGETFAGRVARIAPVLDPATRTASMEIEIPNSSFRLKPGMYARVSFIVEEHRQALVVPTNAVVDIEGKRGVFIPAEGDSAKFQVVLTGLEDADRTEIIEGLREGDQIIATGAAGLREGDHIVLAAQGRGAGASQPGGQSGDRSNGRAGRGRRGNSPSQ
jgi:RND family efflux transporter MFP subunit